MMQRRERFPVSNSQSRFRGQYRVCPSRRQLLIIGFLFVVILVLGYDLAYSDHYYAIQHTSADQLISMVEGGSIIRRGAFFGLLIGGLLLMARTRDDDYCSSAARNNVPLSCFVALAFLSVLWSDDPALTFRRSSEYIIFCIGAAAAGRRLGMRGVVWLGFLGSTGYLLIGVISELVLGTCHPFSVDYRFCGTLHPNHQAWNCVLLLLSGSALLPLLRGFWRVVYLAAMTLGVVCLFLTKSRTSLVCGALALIFYWSARLSRKQKLALALSGCLLGGVLFAATFVDSGVASQSGRMLLAGRDAGSYQDFSGRLPLWRLAMEYVDARPIAGYGFDSFWTPDHIREISSNLGWAVPAPHNGFIGLMLSLGIIGLTLYLYQLAGTWQMLRRSYRVTRNPFVRFYLALLIFYFAGMFTESIAFVVELPTFCVLSVLWSRKLWLQIQFAPISTRTMVPEQETTQAYP